MANTTKKQRTISTKATEAVEAAVCYLQEETAKTGVKLSDKQAFTAIQTAAQGTEFFWTA